MKEIWKEMYNNGEFYECSNTGKVRSKGRNCDRSDGKRCVIKSKILNPSVDGNGYLRTMVRYKDRYRTIKVHREILKAFCPVPNFDKLECNHKDGNKTNNNLENLEWMTRSENIKHSFDIGLQDNFLKGARKHNKKIRKLSFEKIVWAKNERELKLTPYNILAAKLGVHKKTLISAMNGKTYKDIYEQIQKNT